MSSSLNTINFPAMVGSSNNLSTSNSDSPPKLQRQATWSGKYYSDSHACAPREISTYTYKNEERNIVVEVHAPAWIKNLARVFSNNKIKVDSKNIFLWKHQGLPAGIFWMMDILWINLTTDERETISFIHNNALKKWPNDHGLKANLMIQYWIFSQLTFNFPNCITTSFENDLSDIYHDAVSKLEVEMPLIRKFTKGV